MKRKTGGRRFLLLQFWTFEDARHVIAAARRLGFDRCTRLTQFDGALVAQPSTGELLEGRYRFACADLEADSCVGSPFDGLAQVRISPLDPLFPTIDWQARLGRDDARLRAECASSILNLTVLGLDTEPSVLKVRINTPSPNHELFAALAERLGDANVLGVGYLSSGVELPLPPETLAHRSVQVAALRTSFDDVHPIMVMPHAVASRLSNLSSRWARADGGAFSVIFDRKNLAPRSIADKMLEPLKAELLSDEAYRALEESRGVVETPVGTILTQDRTAHPLAQQAIGAMHSIGVELVPFRPGAGSWSAPAIMLDDERATLLRAALAQNSAREALRSPAVAIDDESLGIIDRVLSGAST